MGSHWLLGGSDWESLAPRREELGSHWLLGGRNWGVTGSQEGVTGESLKFICYNSFPPVHDACKSAYYLQHWKPSRKAGLRSRAARTRCSAIYKRHRTVSNIIFVLSPRVKVEDQRSNSCVPNQKGPEPKLKLHDCYRLVSCPDYF